MRAERQSWAVTQRKIVQRLVFNPHFVLFRRRRPIRVRLERRGRSADARVALRQGRAPHRARGQPHLRPAQDPRPAHRLLRRQEDPQGPRGAR